MGIIDTIVLFVTAYLLFQIGRWTILPHLKVGVFSFPGADGMIFKTIMYMFLSIMTMIFHWIIAILFAIYVLWKIIKTYVPELIFIFPVRSILLAMPPFPPLEAAGILPLYDNIVNTLLSGDSILVKLRNIVFALIGFLRSSMNYILSFIGIGGKKTIVVPVPPPPIVSDSKIEADKQSNKQSQDTYLQSKATSDSKITPAQKQEIHSSYLRCIEENVPPLPPDASAIETAYYTLKSSTTTVQCQANAFNAYSDILSLQM